MGIAAAPKRSSPKRYDSARPKRCTTWTRRATAAAVQRRRPRRADARAWLWHAPPLEGHAGRMRPRAGPRRAAPRPKTTAARPGRPRSAQPRPARSHRPRHFSTRPTTTAARPRPARTSRRNRPRFLQTYAGGGSSIGPRAPKSVVLARDLHIRAWNRGPPLAPAVQQPRGQLGRLFRLELAPTAAQAVVVQLRERKMQQARGTGCDRRSAVRSRMYAGPRGGIAAGSGSK